MSRADTFLLTDCSYELSRYEDIEDDMFLSYYDIDPVEILDRAATKAIRDARRDSIAGSSTALLAVLRNDELRLANLGDCCCSSVLLSIFIVLPDIHD